MAGNVLTTNVVGARASLLRIAVSCSILSIVTLGLYSFWGRTRIRRWLWSSVRPGGMPLEYLGVGMEKFTGFVVIASIIAVYTGFLVMIFVFFSLQTFGVIWYGYAATIICMVPLYHLARYRGRRYLVNHTLWRGIRFRMESAWWSYAIIGTLWTALILLTLGLAEPLARYSLEKFKMERTTYGSSAFNFEGNIFGLYSDFTMFYSGAFATGAIAFFSVYSANWTWIGLWVVTLPVAVFGYIHYRVSAFKKLISFLYLTDDITFDIDVSSGRIFAITVLGGLIKNALIFGMLAIFTLFYLSTGREFSLQAVEELPLLVFILGGAVLYIIFVVHGRYMSVVFNTFPIVQHAAPNLIIYQALQLDNISQLDEIKMRDADGLAEMFDFGGGF